MNKESIHNTYVVKTILFCIKPSEIESSFFFTLLHHLLDTEKSDSNAMSFSLSVYYSFFFLYTETHSPTHIYINAKIETMIMIRREK
jgi:hypothetical protein